MDENTYDIFHSRQLPLDGLVKVLGTFMTLVPDYNKLNVPEGAREKLSGIQSAFLANMAKELMITKGAFHHYGDYLFGEGIFFSQDRKYVYIQDDPRDGMNGRFGGIFKIDTASLEGRTFDEIYEKITQMHAMQRNTFGQRYSSAAPDAYYSCVARELAKSLPKATDEDLQAAFGNSNILHIRKKIVREYKESVYARFLEMDEDNSYHAGNKWRGERIINDYFTTWTPGKPLNDPVYLVNTNTQKSTPLMIYLCVRNMKLSGTVAGPFLTGEAVVYGMSSHGTNDAALEPYKIKMEQMLPGLIHP